MFLADLLDRPFDSASVPVTQATAGERLRRLSHSRNLLGVEHADGRV
jgi:hypothetical protein